MVAAVTIRHAAAVKAWVEGGADRLICDRMQVGIRRRGADGLI